MKKKQYISKENSEFQIIKSFKENRSKRTKSGEVFIDGTQIKDPDWIMINKNEAGKRIQNIPELIRNSNKKLVLRIDKFKWNDDDQKMKWIENWSRIAFVKE